LGAIHFYGNDGGTYQECAVVRAEADGDHANNDKPTRLVFSTTADGASSPTERMRIDSSGNVGIGVTTVNADLHIGSAEPTIRLQDTTTNCFAQISSDDNGSIYLDADLGNTRGSSSIRFLVDTSERMRIDSSGRLLVGTSSLSANVSAAFRGNSFGAGVNSSIYMMRDAANPVSGQTLGVIDFTDSNEGIGVEIAAIADANWGAGDYPGRLVFSTTADGASSPTERMRITSSGKICLGCTTAPNPGAGSTDSGFAVNGTGNNAYVTAKIDNGPVAYFRRDGTDGSIFLFYKGNSVVGSISVTGAATAYNTSSDYVDGFLAHEVQDIVPEAITGEKDAVDDDGNPVYQGIDQSKLVPLLTAALQEAIAKIESLEARLTAAGM
jgi:hypothetical protein